MVHLDRHDDPSRVLATFEPELRPLVTDLLAAGFRVVEAWGPVQMAVARLLLERDGVEVDVDAERGFTSVTVRHRGRTDWLGSLVYGWAVASGEPGFVPWSLVATSSSDARDLRHRGHDQDARFGLRAVDWLPDADVRLLDAIEAERRRLLDRHEPLTPEQVVARYAAAVAPH